jgi:hypothetical protein
VSRNLIVFKLVCFHFCKSIGRPSPAEIAPAKCSVDRRPKSIHSAVFGFPSRESQRGTRVNYSGRTEFSDSCRKNRHRAEFRAGVCLLGERSAELFTCVPALICTTTTRPIYKHQHLEISSARVTFLARSIRVDGPHVHQGVQGREHRLGGVDCFRDSVTYNRTIPVLMVGGMVPPTMAHYE